MLTITDIINARISAAKTMNESDIIRYILNEDQDSLQKRNMCTGARYYVGEHDTLLKQYNTTVLEETEESESGEERAVKRRFSNPNRSNHHNVNAFHKLLVDQKTGYMVGREPTISVSGAESRKELQDYEELITTFADEQFNEVLQDLVKGASNKGFEVIHFYYDEAGALKYCIIPAEECIPIYDSRFQTELIELIRYYTITVVKGGQRYQRRKVEWWTKEQVTYYVEKEENLFVQDPDIPINPTPHWWDIHLLNGMEKNREAHAWGRVPFVILQNNAEMTTDLQPIKGLIDAYDMISSEGTNTLLDLVDLYWVIQGYGGETAAAIARKLQINHAVNIDDTNGSVAAHQVELSLQGRIDYLKMLRRDIYHFGMGIDIDNDTFGTAPSGVSLQFHYAGLDHKAGNMAAKLKKAIKDLFWFVTDDYNRKNGTAYDSSLIKVNLNYSKIANDAEVVQIITQSKGIISDKTLLENHPYVTDVNEELKQIELEEKEGQERFNAFQGTFPTNQPPGGEDT